MIHLPARPARGLTILAAVGLLAAAAPAARADTVTFDAAGTLVVTAGAERNDVGLQPSPYEDGRIVIYDGASGTTVTSASPACQAQGPSNLICSWNPTAGARVDLGGGDDWGYVSSELPAAAPLAIAGGAGNDNLQSSLDGQPTTLDGGSGDDVLAGGPGRDTLLGGDGNDTLQGKAGADRLDGGSGDDTLSGDGNKGAAPDVIDGGPGTDVIESDWSDDSVSSQRPVSVTLGGGSDDGRPGEGDDVHGVERIVSHAAGRLVGTGAPEHLEASQIIGSVELLGNGGNDVLRGADGPDRIDGGAGDDDIDGGFGDDHIVGGPGRDHISGDRIGGDCGPLWCKYPYGNDTIDARDGEVDSIVCGFGTDTVYADAIDVVDRDCEHVVRDDTGAGGGSGRTTVLSAKAIKAKLRSALAHGLRVRVTTPGAGRLRVTATASGRKVAAGSRTVKRAGAATVTLRFSKGTRAKLRRKRRVTFRVAVRFAPTRGAARARTIGVTLR